MSTRDPNRSADIRALRSEVGSLRRALSDLQLRTRSDLRRLEGDLYRSIESLLGLHRELDGLPAVPALGGWAISPDLARLLVELMRQHQPQIVLELGSGASTILMGGMLQRRGSGRLVSLEHDPLWYATSLEHAHAAGIADVVDLKYAPLVPCAIGSTSYEWYSPDALEDSQDADIVLIDGPPGGTGPMARYPAGPYLISQLKSGCVVIVDDMIREDEQRMLELWTKENDVSILDRPDVSKGAVILQVNSQVGFH